MVRRHYALPPLTTLAAFETAARRGSFKAAAEELNVTPGAVSHQIKALEADLGIALFARVHRGVTLTDEGRVLTQTLEGAFRSMSDTLAGLRRTREGRAITVGATTAVAALWLTPRITRFWREHPDIRINQLLSDSPHPPGSAPDLSIFYGARPGAGPAHLLFTDQLVPLAATSVAEQAAAGDLAALARLPLIHLNAESQRWTTWDTWFAALGYRGPLSRGMRVNNYMIALQAAQDGAGVVLGWKRLVRPFIDSGALRVLGDWSIPAPSGFFIQSDPAVADDPHVALLQDWLRASSDESISPDPQVFHA